MNTGDRPEFDSFIDYLQASLELAQELEDSLESLRKGESKDSAPRASQSLIDAAVA